MQSMRDRRDRYDDVHTIAIAIAIAMDMISQSLLSNCGFPAPRSLVLRESSSLGQLCSILGVLGGDRGHVPLRFRPRRILKGE